MVGSVLFSSILLSCSLLVTGIPVNNDSAPPSPSKRTAQTKTQTVLRKRTFSVTQTQHVAEQFDGAYALRKAYLKHGLPLPGGLEKRQLVGGGQTGDVLAVSEANDLEYVSPVSVGGTMMRLDFDTGSSDLWVFSDRLPADTRKSHNFYITQPNTTVNGVARTVTGSEKSGFKWKIAYGDGTGASGIVFADRVTVGGVTATAQAVEAATSVAKQFVAQRSDGLLGLGFGRTNTVTPQKQQTFFENVKGQLAQPVFTVSLKKNATGVYDFGYVDEKKYTGNLQYVNVNTTRGYWEYTATGYQVGNKPAASLKFQAIADTGTTLLLLPPQAVQDYYAQVSGAQSVAGEGGYVFPCASAGSLPDLTLAIGGNVSVVVPGHFVNRGASATGSGKCYGGIQNGSVGLSIWGDIFLKSQFVVFDGGEVPRLGFAPQALGVVAGSVPKGLGVGFDEVEGGDDDDGTQVQEERRMGRRRVVRTKL